MTSDFNAAQKWRVTVILGNVLVRLIYNLLVHNWKVLGLNNIYKFPENIEYKIMYNDVTEVSVYAFR